MNAEALITKAKEAGVILSLSPDGKLKLAGHRPIIEKLLPDFKKHKPEIIKIISHDKQKARDTTGYRWILEHLGELLSHGWTSRELYHQYNGLAWIDLWSDQDVITSLGDKGEIVFTLHRNHGTVIQTARPHAQLFS